MSAPQELRDWDLWPWIVNEHADDSGLRLSLYRIELGMRRTATAIGAYLVPAMRRFGLRFAEASKAFEALHQGVIAAGVAVEERPFHG